MKKEIKKEEIEVREESLVDKAIDIKGKKYVLVSDRIIYFNDQYKQGAILSEIISPLDSDRVIVLSKVIPNINFPLRYFTGYSQAKWGEGFINKTSAIENAETSAVGRALAMMGIGVIDSIASVDEINKATTEAKGSEKLDVAKNIINNCNDIEKLRVLVEKTEKAESFTPVQKKELIGLINSKLL